eukprot:RCo025601
MASISYESLKQKRKELYQTLAHGHRVVVVTGATGTGKSSCVPLWLLDYCDSTKEARAANLRGESPVALPKPQMHRVLCCQPRRVATRALCEYLREKRCAEMHRQGLCTKNYSEEVGWMISMDCKNPEARLVYCTTGYLLSGLASLIRGLRFVVLDEVHEKSQEVDALLCAM